jgi:hypothetical protein
MPWLVAGTSGARDGAIVRCHRSVEQTLKSIREADLADLGADVGTARPATGSATLPRVDSLADQLTPVYHRQGQFTP